MRMSQALGNVLNNAIRCTEANGRVVVRAELEGDGAAVLTVIDDGIGIDGEDLPHVFDRFYRTDQSQRHGIGGTGLGLAIARTVVEAHGGTVAVTSDGVGKGAAVTFRLPLDR
ncbi:MAG: ATP-binding protein, partial [Caldilineaceae bacterium]|nr:ATP-binding protein [Caldilineaceae bacterium]